MTVNGVQRALVVHSSERLLDVLRNRLGLKGAKDGCSTGDCGTCVVVVDGRLVNSCLMLAVQAREREIETVEGIGTPERLHPVQETFMDFNASQCGYCIPGMIMTAKHLLDHNSDPTVMDVRRAISGVLCRCTGYWKIIEAVQAAARLQRGN
jgi:carbon-monoxide dehydrogenase small subunit